MGTPKTELSPTASSLGFTQAPGRKAEDHGCLVLILLQRQMLLGGGSLSNCNHSTEKASPALPKTWEPSWPTSQGYSAWVDQVSASEEPQHSAGT